MARSRRDGEDSQGAMSNEDIAKIVGELRYVLRNAAVSDDTDRKVVLDLTKTIEDLTERKIDKMRDWDPAYGHTGTTSSSTNKEALLRHLEDVRDKLPEKPSVHRKSQRHLDKEDTSLRGMLSSFLKKLRGG